jgi:Holliday junction resolvase RusA-like endonuclease
VFGVAQSAGSKRALPAGGRAGGRPIVIDDNPKSKAWQSLVAGEAARAMQEQEVTLMQGALCLRLRFVRVRPGGHYTPKGELTAEGRRQAFPAKRPDVTKLIRGVEDALTRVVWRDDAQVVQQEATKVWGEPERVEVEVGPARPFRSGADGGMRLLHLSAAIGDTSSEVERDEQLGLTLTMLERPWPCACGAEYELLAAECASCGRATFSPYGWGPAKRAADVPPEPEQGSLQIARFG